MAVTTQNNPEILFVGVDQMEASLVIQFLDITVKTEFAYSLGQAQELLSGHSYKIVICEAERRGLDVRKLFDHQDTSSFIFLSSRDRDLEQRKSMLKIKDCYLTRPYSAEQLQKATLAAKHPTRLH
jgi:DNA-binding response OmpR family regulator